MSALDLPMGGRRYLQIAQGLADRIVAGEFGAGDRLPPERDLAQQLGASRTTVREALLALEIMRMVEIRVGAGVFVLPEDERARGSGPVDTAGPWDVLEARRAVEGQAAFAAAMRADDTVMAAMEQNVTGMEQAIDDVPLFDRLDAAFHALIARASGNALFESYVAHLWQMRRGEMWRTWYAQTRHPDNRRRSVADHRAIQQAIGRRRPAEAQTAMQAHLDVLAGRFLDLQL